jgi:AcrR family transcriptional regulator
MSAVAIEAKVSAGGLYRYFEDKEDLFAVLIGDLHEELYSASRARHHNFAEDPYGALLEANRGYLAAYYDNRDLMRTFIEASGVYSRFREIWWRMRRRHVDRFVKALSGTYGITSVDGMPAEVVADAMACMVEQAAYVWYAHDELNERTVNLDEAAKVATLTWFRTFFPSRTIVNGEGPD